MVHNEINNNESFFHLNHYYRKYILNKIIVMSINVINK